MKKWILISSLLGICSAMPILPQHAGIPGMGSISLETMRQLGRPNMPNLLPQFAQPYSYADPFHSMWMHNFLPSHSSYFWIKGRPQHHETQQYEYSMPVHPPPLPSQQTPTLFQQPGLQEQPHYQFTDLIPTKQVQLQQHNKQPPFQPKQFPLPEGKQPVVQQLPPLERQTQQLPAVQEYLGTLGQTLYPGLHGTQQDAAQQPQQQSIYPSLYYMSYVANQGGAPARLGIVSSEEMQGGGLGAPAYQAPGPNLFAMDARFGNMQPNLGQPGDYTVEDEQLGITEQPEDKGGANPSGKGNNVIPLDGNQGGVLPNANSNLLNPAAQSNGLSGVPQATVAPLATQGLPDSFIPFNADTTMPLDPTMFPDTTSTNNAGNEAGYPQVGQDMWHFQEP
ncbi:ameloblastin [Rhineura floridana]|uniref:ameloblastin n=1 Tax=Rhineura floridana TaxID=261503 RepID=UPI002AC881C2|nr:ameloblastin [Rhineura floridana]